MWNIRHIRQAGSATIALGILVALGPIARAQRPDPVEELRQALKLEDVSLPNAEQIEFRRTNLDKKIDALKTIRDLRLAVALDDWKEDPEQRRDVKLRQIDEQKRKIVGKRLQDAIRFVVANGQPTSRLAVANLIAEMGPTVRALDIEDKGGFARSLTDQVELLAKDADPGVRQEGLRALGTINAEPEHAAAVFKHNLDKGNRDFRLLAARGLAQMMLVANQLNKRSQPTQRVETSPKDVLRTAQAVLTACREGIKDADPEVRSTCLTAFQSAAQGLGEQINVPLTRKDFPPEGRKLTDDEAASILGKYEEVRGHVNGYTPLFKLLRENSPHVIPTLEDADVSVRLSGINALETITWARLKQKNLLESVPLPSSAKGKVALIEWEDPLRDLLGKGLTPAARLLADPEVRIRRAAIDFFENLEEAALPAIPALTEALKDSDRFVRWAAARALGNLPPEKTQTAILELARLLSDSDLDVRKAAAKSLMAAGAAGRAAMPVLQQAILDGDVEGRLMALEVVGNLPPEDAKACIPQLKVILANKDARLRKAAAEVLETLGPLAQPALPDLRRLLGDEDPEVRQAGSDAILSILVRSK